MNDLVAEVASALKILFQHTDKAVEESSVKWLPPPCVLDRPTLKRICHAWVILFHFDKSLSNFLFTSQCTLRDISAAPLLPASICVGRRGEVEWQNSLKGNLR